MRLLTLALTVFVLAGCTITMSVQPPPNQRCVVTQQDSKTTIYDCRQN